MNDWNEPAYSHPPLMWIRTYPVYLTTILVVVHCVALVIDAITTGCNWPVFPAWFRFTSDQVLGGQVWRMGTYVLLHPPIIWFAIEMAMLYWFGRDVEKHIGRRAFAILYAALILIPAGAMTAVGLRWEQIYYGSQDLHFAVFIAFATLYPRLMFFAIIQARYLAYIFLALDSLQYFAHHAWTFLGVLWLSTAIAYFSMRLLGAQGGFDWLNRWRAAVEARRLEREEQRRRQEEEPVDESVNEILEKIASKGMGSLTPSEKRTLERTRSALLRKK
jgi:membrane associated rhomboid family serine protease